MDEAEGVEQLVHDAGAGEVAAADTDEVVAVGAQTKGAAALESKRGNEGEDFEGVQNKMNLFLLGHCNVINRYGSGSKIFKTMYSS